MNEAGLLDRIEALEGKVLAAHAAIRALICCHPHPEKAIDTVCRHLDTWSGIALESQHPDPMVDALAVAQVSLIPNEDEIARDRLGLLQAPLQGTRHGMD